MANKYNSKIFAATPSTSNNGKFYDENLCTPLLIKKSLIFIDLVSTINKNAQITKLNLSKLTLTAKNAAIIPSSGRLHGAQSPIGSRS